MSNTAEYKKIICIDFDGVIHNYERGWQGGELYGTVTEGFFEWMNEASKKFKLVIYSSRSSNAEMLTKMTHWLEEKWDEYNRGKQLPIPIEFTHEKPPAFLTIDDRCVRFTGNWNDVELQPDEIERFKPWIEWKKITEPPQEH